MPYPANFAKNLRAARLAARFSVPDLAHLSGLSASNIYSLEKRHTEPRLTTLTALARALNLSPLHLLAPPSPTLLQRLALKALQNKPSSPHMAPPPRSQPVAKAKGDPV